MHLIKMNLLNQVFESIVSQLKDLEYNGIVVYSGFNEPLLNKNIFKNISQTRNYLTLK